MRHLLLASVFAAGLATAADANTFRWANDGDVNSMDPYARNETFLLTFLGNVYEPLVRRDRELRVEPALAVRWEQPSPTVWRFHLRPDVKFHDGTAFTAEDVVFSVARAKGQGSNVSAKLATVTEARVVDPLTVELVTAQPNPILLEEIADFFIMSKRWAEANNAVQAADLTRREENYATRNANGTGPFRVVTREPDQRTVLEPNPNWWDRAEHNLTRVEFNVIANAATRVAALLSGEVDMVYTVPPQDVERIGRTSGFRIHQKAELRTIFLGFDQQRDQLLKSDVQGRNPFKDVRVRRAFVQAIDVEAIRSRVMRGNSIVTGTLFPPQVNGYSREQDVRLPFNADRARALLAEAGYPQGFEVTLDCPNNRYINDEQICQAVAAMWTRVGVTTRLNAMPLANFFPKIQREDTSIYLLGWGVPTLDALYSIQSLLASKDGEPGNGIWNYGNYANPRVDELTRIIKNEGDPEKRTAAIHEVLRIYREDVPHIPLHHQMIPWAMRSTVSIPHMANNQPYWRWAKMN